jgi:hypothetical protein
MLVLPEGSFIEYRLPENLTDTEGIDIAVMLFVWGREPQVTFVDHTDAELELNVGAYQSHPSGFRIHGFDIAGLAHPLKALRVTGLDNAGPHGGCGLGPIDAYTGESKSDHGTRPAESTESLPVGQREPLSIPQ